MKLKFIQKYIADKSEELHQRLVLLGQTETGLDAINGSKIALRIMNADFNPWELTFLDLRLFMDETNKVCTKAEMIKEEQMDELHNYFCQLYSDIWLNYGKIPGLRYEWDHRNYKANFLISGSIRLSFDCGERDALYCIAILENLRQADETFEKEVEVRSKKGVTTPSTNGCVALAQARNNNKARLYALIGYGPDGNPLLSSS